MEILEHLRAWCVVSGPSAHYASLLQRGWAANPRSAEMMEPETTHFRSSKLLGWWHVFFFTYQSLQTYVLTEMLAIFVCLFVFKFF